MNTQKQKKIYYCNVGFDKPTNEKITKLAVEYDGSKSQVVRMAMKLFIRKMEKENAI
jgi:hypothetical protein